MKIIKNDPPRTFEAGFDKKTAIKDCGTIELSSDEQVTFITGRGNEYDLVRKNWGFYATPSLNGRLLKFNLRAVLVKNRANLFYVLLVEKGMEESFQNYAETERLTLISWLDATAVLEKIEQCIRV
jgi:hypothetical protein